VANEVLIRRIATAAAVTCLAVVAITALLISVPSLRARVALLSVRTSYRVGERIDVSPHVYENSPLTLLVFTRSNCAACQAAKPALKNIAGHLKATPAQMILVVGSPDASSEIGYASEIGLDRTRIAGVNLTALRLQSVPTLVLVSRSGEVLYTTEGPPSDQQQQELFQVVRSNASRS
jgi:thioredoxin-related protein